MNPPHAPRSGSAGLTLVELLAVIAIIGVLVAITIPVVGKVRSSAQNAECKSNLRQIGQACMIYAADNRGHLPGFGRRNSEEFPRYWQDVLEATTLTEGVIMRAGAATGRPIIDCPAFDRPTTQTAGYTYRTYGMNPRNVAPRPEDRATLAAANAAGWLTASPPEGWAWMVHGVRINQWQHPARKVLVADLERADDYVRLVNGSVARIDAADLVDGRFYEPRPGGQFSLVFRHPGTTMNAVMLDGSVQALGLDSGVSHDKRYDFDSAP